MIKGLIRVFIKGGIISPGDLLKITNVGEKLGASYLHFGSRQDVLFSVEETHPEVLEKAFRAIDTAYEINSFQYQNIASSYVALDLLPTKKWLASHIYHYVLDSFDYLPRLRINIVDPSQGLVPLFTGNINFLASNHENYWYLYLRFSALQSKPWQFPVLIYSEDLAIVSKILEEMDIVANGFTYQKVYDELIKKQVIDTQPVSEPLMLPNSHFPYYEGINRMQDDKYWLGLYWRNNQFGTDIIKAICEKCLHTGLGKLSLTPWKSFIIKGISEKDRVGWEKLMGRFGMNLRHSALELNWHIPALDQEALALKADLVATLDQHDISTSGLTFTIKTSDDIVLFTSVVIEKNLEKTNGYNILYAKDFNPNAMEYSYFAKGIVKEVIAPLLVELSHLYYEHLDEQIPASQEIAEKPNSNTHAFQCSNCLTIYNEMYGDPVAKIENGTAFRDLPEDYKCPVCGASKSKYIKIT